MNNVIVWRDDKLNPRDVPRLDALVICAEDDGGKGDSYQLVIVHARTTYGRGFMPSVRLIGNGGVKHNGDVIIGEDVKTREAALREGATLLQRAEADLDAEMAKLETLAAQRKAQATFKKTRALPCMTDEDIAAVYAEHVAPDDHSCGCDGAYDDGCPWCTREKLVAWQSARVRARFNATPSEERHAP